MTQSSVCCQQDCLGGNLIAGVDATEYWMVRAANTHTQLAKQVMIREFHRQFPGICRNTVQAVLGVSRIQSPRPAPNRAKPPPHGLIAHYQSNPRPLTFAQKRMLDFFQTFIAGCRPVILASNINSAIQVNGRKGLWNFFLQNESNDGCSVYDVHGEFTQVPREDGLSRFDSDTLTTTCAPPAECSSTKKTRWFYNGHC